MPLGTTSSGRITKIRRNWLEQVTEAAEDRHPYGNRTGPPAALPAGLIPIRNRSGDTLARFDVVGIGAPVLTPGDNLEAFVDRAGFDGVAPVLFDHALKFAIVVDPIAYDSDEAATGWGYGVFTGLVVAKVDIRNEHHTHATLRNDDDDELPTLWSEFGGPGRIIAQEDDGATGSKFCLLDLQPSVGRWKADGYLTGTLDAAVVNGTKVTAETVGVRIWLTDEAGDVSVDTEANVTAYNVSESVSGLESFRAELEFDGVAWRVVGLDCDASALPGASGP